MKLPLLLSSLLASTAIHAQGKVVADVVNFHSDNGVCRACLFNSEAAYDDRKPLQCQQVIIANGKAQATFLNLPAGTYAISVFHDANNNNEFDKNFLGIPKEGYGASGNHLPFASAPAFNDNKFQIKDNTITTLSIRLRYL